MDTFQITGKQQQRLLQEVASHRLVQWEGATWITEGPYCHYDQGEGRRLLMVGGDETDWADAPHEAEVVELTVFEVVELTVFEVGLG